jgi:hypothetical protein
MNETQAQRNRRELQEFLIDNQDAFVGLLQYLRPGGNVEGGLYRAPLPYDLEKKPTLTVDLCSAVWEDTVLKKSGPNIYQLIASALDMPIVQTDTYAYQWLTEYLKNEKRNAIKTMPKFVASKYKLPDYCGFDVHKLFIKMASKYFDEKGYLIMYELGFSTSQSRGPEIFAPMIYDPHGKFYNIGFRTLPRKRPIYNLNNLAQAEYVMIFDNLLAANTAKQIWPVEKFSTTIPTTWLGDVYFTDWSNIKDKRVLIFPRAEPVRTQTPLADQSGYCDALFIAEIMYKQKNEVSIIDPIKFAGNFEFCTNVHEARQRGYRAEDIREFVKANRRLYK